MSEGASVRPATFGETGQRPDDAGVWRGPLPADLLWLEAGAEAVVYDRRSGQTHLLNPAATAALRRLVEGPVDRAGLAASLAAQDAAADAAAYFDLAAEILAVFDRLGLAEPAGL